MPNYRRALVPGATWFFTVNLFDRESTLLVDRIDALNLAIDTVRDRFPFEIDALVVLPNHLHAIWSLPPGDANFAVRWNQIKVRFSKSIPQGEIRSRSRAARGERGIWQRRYWEHLIADDRDFNEHLDYCWINPVKHGFVDRVEDWPHSTFHRDYIIPDRSQFESFLAGALNSKFGERR